LYRVMQSHLATFLQTGRAGIKDDMAAVRSIWVKRGWAASFAILAPFLPLVILAVAHVSSIAFRRAASRYAAALVTCLAVDHKPMPLPLEHLRAPEWLPLLAGVVVVWNLLSSLELFDGYHMRPMPFAISELMAELPKLKVAEDFRHVRAPLFNNSDFERGDLRNWTEEGAAFGVTAHLR